MNKDESSVLGDCLNNKGPLEYQFNVCNEERKKNEC